jgi:hypothetical protein
VRGARAADVVRNVERGLRPGAIVLMHDIHPWTAAALPQVLQAITKRGLRAVSVPELLALDPPPQPAAAAAPVEEVPLPEPELASIAAAPSADQLGLF